MVYTVGAFKDLIQRYPSWSDLKEFLQSAEGGILTVIEDSIRKEAIIRYQKQISILTFPHVRWFRSVVWNTETNRPLCVAPPKASVTETYIQSNTHFYQDYLDGVMINAYKEADSDSMKLVSRSSFDAAGTFYSQRPFYELVKDAFVCQQDGSGDLSDWLPPVDESSSVFMSILLQHPEHRVVGRVHEPKLYLVHTGRVDQYGSVYIYEDTIHNAIPPVLGPQPQETIAQWFQKEVEKRGWEWQGVIIKDGTGNRWRMRSNAYRMVRSLRGNTARNDVRFTQLFQNNMIDTYLYYYPEEHMEFIAYLQQLETIVKILYDRYIRLHITKTLNKNQLESVWKPHIFALHGLYLFTLKPKKQFIREKDVRTFIYSLPWQQLLFLVHHRYDSAPVYS